MMRTVNDAFGAREQLETAAGKVTLYRLVALEE